MDDSAEEHPGPTARRARGSRRRASTAALLVVPVLCGGAVGTVFRGTDRAAVAVTDTSAALAAAANIPVVYLRLYQQAATTCGLRWEFLAAVGRLESDHGRAKAVGVASGENAWGAAGPMQFLAGTWVQYGTADPNDRYDPTKAVPAAARFLCAIGARSSEFKAASNYFAGPYATGKARVAGDAYATRIVQQATTYATVAASFGSSSPPPPTGTTTPATTTATTKPRTATTQAVKPKATTTTKAPVAPKPTTPPTTAAPSTPPATASSRKKIPPASVSGYVVKAKP